MSAGQIHEVTDAMIVILMDSEQPTDYTLIPEFKTNLEATNWGRRYWRRRCRFPTRDGFKNPIPVAKCDNAGRMRTASKHNMAFSADYPDKLIRGLKYVMEIVEASHGIIAIKPHNRQAV